MKLGQKTSLWSVTIADNILAFPLFNKLKNSELLALSKHWLWINNSLRQYSYAKVEVGPPSEPKRNFCLHVPRADVHINVTDLQVGTCCGLTDAVKPAGEFPTRLLLHLLACRFFE